MTHTAKTAPEADEKMIKRLRDAMTFDQRGLELLGPETTRRLAFAVCNKLGLIPRSTEQAEVFLNAMRAAGQLSVADVNSAKWDLLGEEHSAGHTFASVDEPCPVALAKELEKRLSGRKPTLRQQIKAAAEGGPRGRLSIPNDDLLFSATMKLHEVMTVRDGVWVIKVPGGWVYTLSINTGECCSVFVPEPPLRRTA